jgi:hypothetical protein
MLPTTDAMPGPPHHAHLFPLREGVANYFFLRWLRTTILLISASQAAKSIGWSLLFVVVLGSFGFLLF